jgi:hypothetical protein
MQPWENCNAEKLPYYTAVQAGIRWCGLTKYEDEILETMREKGDGVKFSQWPCLQPRIAELRYAMRIEEIPHGVDGNPKFDGQARSESRWTMTHADLRRWFKENASQTEWPAFLFDEIERGTHSSFTAEAVQAIKLERDAARAELARLKADAQGKDFQIAAMEKQIAALKVEIEKAGVPGQRSETTYLNIIGALLEVIEGSVPGFGKHPDYEGGTNLSVAIATHFQGFSGLSQSNLSRKFPEAKRSLTTT